jgi:hypothetical protein
MLNDLPQARGALLEGMASANDDRSCPVAWVGFAKLNVTPNQRQRLGHFNSRATAVGCKHPLFNANLPVKQPDWVISPA